MKSYVVTKRVQRVRRYICANRRRGLKALARRAHRRERRAVKQALHVSVTTGAEFNYSTPPNHLFTERDVV